MPERRKVRWSQLKVGAVALVALIILAVLIFLLTGTRGIFQRYATIRTYMDDASGMAEKAPVRLNGILIGYVDRLRLSGAKDRKRTVEFDMAIQEKFLPEIPENSTAAINAATLLGDKFINITKGDSARHVQPGAELRSLQVQDIPELMAESANLLQSFQDVVKRTDKLLAGVEAGNGNIGKFLKDEELYNRMNSVAAEGRQLMADVRNGKGTLSRLLYDDSLYQEMRSPLKRIDSMLADLQSGRGSAGKLLKDPQLYEDAQKSLAEMRNLIAQVNAGKGTAGKLLKDEQLYRRMNQLAAKIDRTLDKLNTGDGTLGELLANPQLYEALAGATREFQALAKDIRANPKKFLRIKLALF